jgi:hypothetical protein
VGGFKWDKGTGTLSHFVRTGQGDRSIVPFCHGTMDLSPCPFRLSSRNVKIFVLLVFLLLAVGFFLHQGQALYLVVEAPREGETLYRLPIKAGQVFELEYTHSVTGRIVRGSFEITGEKRIKPLTTRFDTFGPGLPYLDGSLRYVVENGMYIVFHEEDPREDIGLFVSPLTGEALLLAGKRWELGNLRDAPLLVRIFVAGR